MEKYLPGTKFGKWTVLKFIGIDKASRSIYECKCDCGRIRQLGGSILKNAKSTQCTTCGKKEQTRSYLFLKRKESFINEHRMRTWQRL